MAMFGLKKSKPAEGSDLILAYLEDAQRVRATFLTVDPKGREVGASLVAVTEERVTLGVQGRLMAEKGESVGILFYLDGLRLKATGRLLEVKTGTAVVELPTSLDLAERRKKARARLNQREGATAIALTGLFEGIGLTGTIENISEGGFYMRVTRAMNVKTQGPMHLGANLISPGEPFMMLKLTKLPKCPTLELDGIATHVKNDGGALMVGFSFSSDKESLLSPVRSLVTSRAGSIPSSVPAKARRVQEPEPAPSESPIELAPTRPAPQKEPEVVPAPAAPPEPPPSHAPVPPLTSPAPEPHRNSALLRVKKRTRTILLAMPEGPEREALAAFLEGDGYGKVLVAATLTDLMGYLDGVSLLIVDGGVAELQGLGLATALHGRLGEDMPPTILAEDAVDSDLVLGARQVGVAQILVKPYDFDEELQRLIEETLGLV